MHRIEHAAPTKRAFLAAFALPFLLYIALGLALAPTTVFVVATTTILGLQMFNEPFILQAPAQPSGPGNSTLTPVIYLYRNAFQEFEIGYASAVAWALFILIFGITLLYFRRSGDEGALKA